MKIGELFVKLGFDADTLKVRDFITLLGELNLASVASALGFGALGALADKWIQKTVDAAVPLSNFTTQTGMSAEMLQKWGNIALITGSNLETVTNSLIKFQARTLAMQKGNLDPAYAQALFILNQYGKAGINPQTDRPEMIMEKMRLSFGRLSESNRIYVRDLMGLDASMSNVLKASNEQIMQADKINYLTQEEADNVARLSREFAAFGAVLNNTVIKVLADMAPYIENVLHFLDEVIPMIGKFTTIPEFKMAGLMGSTAGITNTVAVNIHGAGGSPAEIARLVAQEIGKIFRNTAYQTPKEST